MSYFDFSDDEEGRQRKIDRETEIKNLFCLFMYAENNGVPPRVDQVLKWIAEEDVEWCMEAPQHVAFIDSTVEKFLANSEEFEEFKAKWRSHLPPRLATFDEVVASGRIDPTAVEVFQRSDGMGRSVRTRRAFKRGQPVCSYGGRVLQAYNRPVSDFVLQLSKKFIVDGNPSLPEASGHAGSFINDAAGPIRTAGVENNLRFSLGTVQTADGQATKTVILKAKRNLPPNTELFISYGPSYWPRAKKMKVGL